MVISVVVVVWLSFWYIIDEMICQIVWFEYSYSSAYYGENIGEGINAYAYMIAQCHEYIDKKYRRKMSAWEGNKAITEQQVREWMTDRDKSKIRLSLNRRRIEWWAPCNKCYRTCLSLIWFFYWANWFKVRYLFVLLILWSLRRFEKW